MDRTGSWKAHGPATGAPDDVVTITPLGNALLVGNDLAHARALAETACTLEEMQGTLDFRPPGAVMFWGERRCERCGGALTLDGGETCGRCKLVQS